MRGVVEGFYGAPWSHEERLALLGFLAAQGLDTYLYAPKNDLHHRRHWQRPYPPLAMERFGELFARGEQVGVSVVFGVAPARLLGWNNVTRLGDRDGDGIGDAGWQALSAKLLALQGVGGRRFALLFDDTATTFVPALGGAGLGRFHARVAQRCLELLRRQDPGADLLLVPAAYSGTWEGLGRAGRAYWAGLSDLGDAAPVAWTGADIFSRRIRGTEVAELQEATGLRLVVWNNAVANDWVHLATGELLGLRGWRKLSYGPVANLDADVADVSAGVLLNGALEPRLSRISLASLARWFEHGAAYDPVRAHADALQHAGPPDALARLHDLVARHLLVAPDRREAPALSRALDDRDPHALRAALEAVRFLEADLADADPVLQREVDPTLRKAHLLASAALADLDGRPSEGRARRAQARRIRWLVARRPFARLARELSGPRSAASVDRPADPAP